MRINVLIKVLYDRGGRTPKNKEKNERDLKSEWTKLTLASIDTSCKQGTLSGNKQNSMIGV